MTDTLSPAAAAVTALLDEVRQEIAGNSDSTWRPAEAVRQEIAREAALVDALYAVVKAEHRSS